MHAVVLAGGKGVRLRPYTTALPKALVPIGGEHAILEIVFRQLHAAGFRTIDLAIGHLGQLIRAYCGDGSRWGLEVAYWEEASPLGTIGPIVANLDRLPAQFLVMNGDVLTDLDYAALLDGHISSGAPITVATCEREEKIDFGVLEIGGDSGDRIVAFREKPVERFTVSMGVYAMSRDTLRTYAPGKALGFDELMLDLIQTPDRPRVHRFTGFWLDIGRPDDYDAANEKWERLEPLLLPRD